MITDILFSICFIIFLAIASYIILHDVVPYLDRKNDIMEQQMKNDKYKLFMNIDADVLVTKVNNYFEGYVKRYMTYKFVANNKSYIKAEEIDTMVKDLTRLIAMDISELYVFYIKMIQNINTDDDIIAFIHTQIKNISIDYISNYNKPNGEI